MDAFLTVLLVIAVVILFSSDWGKHGNSAETIYMVFVGVVAVIGLSSGRRR